MTTTPGMLDASEIARRLNVSRATAYREMHKMLHVVIGERALRVSEAALEAYLRGRTAAPAKDVLRGKHDRVRPISPRTRPAMEQTA